MATLTLAVLALAAGAVSGEPRPHPCAALNAHREDLAWVRARCQPLSPSDDARVALTEGLLGRLQRRGRRARLLVLGGAPGPSAYITRDDVVVVTRQALDLCTRHRGRALPEAQAQANLAFLLSHELAHAYHDDHLRVLLTGQDPRYFEFATALNEELELTADRAALLDVARAHLDARHVLDGGLLRTWATTDGDRAWWEKRRLALRRFQTRVGQALPLFFASSDFLAAGRYPDVAELLGTFTSETGYRGPEVSSDHAYALLQQAQRSYAECDRAGASRFVWPGAFDADTRLVSIVRGPAERTECLEKSDFGSLLEEARGLLEDAVKLDPTYLPARLNLATAYLLGDHGLYARAVLEDAPPPGSVEERNALGHAKELAKYVDGVTGRNRQQRGEALQCMRDLAQSFPNDIAIAYNLARMLSETAPDPAVDSVDVAHPASVTREDARQAWQRVLDLDVPAPLADAAREELRRLGVGVADEPVDGGADRSTCPVLPSPARDGVPQLGSPLAAKHKGQPLDDASGSYWRYTPEEGAKSPGWRAYVNSPKQAAPKNRKKVAPTPFLVVEPLEPQVSLDDVRAAHGIPEADLPLVDGRRILRFAPCRPEGATEGQDEEIGYAYVIDGARAVERVSFGPQH
jgi:tetratricopeptide (TPR) repeat protein